MGRYNFTEKLSGPEKVSKRLFSLYTNETPSRFIQYFFDGKKYSIWKKLFGKVLQPSGTNSEIITIGLFQIYGSLKSFNPGIIHITAFERFAIIALFYKMFNKVKIIFNMHGITAYENARIKKTTFFYRLKDKICERWLVKKADKIVFVSKQAMDIAEKYYAIRDSQIVIMANGVDKVFNILESKNYSHIKAVMMYANELYESGFEFINNYLSNYSCSIGLNIITDSEVKIKGNVINPMPSNELADFYKDKHLYFALNNYDTFSISTAEAMASGLVPIVTKQTGISRFIQNGFNGYIVDYGNIDELKQVIEQYINLTSEEKLSLSTNAAKIYDELKWDNVYSSYKNIYKELV